jgi:hypothetical protein
VSSHEVGVKVGVDDPLDHHAVPDGGGQVVADVPAWVDNDCPAAGLVADQIRGVRQARDVELLQHHFRFPCR